jgi:hypothetical protein
MEQSVIAPDGSPSGAFWIEEGRPQYGFDDMLRQRVGDNNQRVEALQQAHLVRQIRHLRKRVGLTIQGRLPAELYVVVFLLLSSSSCTGRLEKPGRPAKGADR